MKVKDVMSAEVRTCSPNNDLGRAAQIMWEGDCGIVPVVEPDDYLVGVVTDRDACMAAYTQGRTLAAVRTGDVMSRQLRTLRPEEDAEAAGAAMGKLRVRRLPVVDGLGRLVELLPGGSRPRHRAREAPRGAARAGVLRARCPVPGFVALGSAGDTRGRATERSPAARRRGQTPGPRACALKSKA